MKRIGFVGLIFLVLAGNPRAANLVVYNTNDGGAGSLRGALASAADGDKIQFAVTGTILLTGGQLVVTNSVDIIGPGPNLLAVNGNFASRVFYIGCSHTVSISGLTITNGYSWTNSFPADSGGGIHNDHATLTVSNVTISGNAGDFGGGVYNNGESAGMAVLTVISSTLNGNGAGNGGAICNDGFNGGAILEIVNSTLSGNSGTGGGVFNLGANGSNGSSGCGTNVLPPGTANLRIVNSTLSGNSGGGIVNNGSAGSTHLQILHSTLAGDTGGEFHSRSLGGSTTVEIGSSILASGSGGNIVNDWGVLYISFTSLGYNLSTDNGYPFLGATDKINTNPMLGPLQDNGGPTPTMMPTAGSPAIDQGKRFGVATDQRGRCRTYDDLGTSNAIGGDGTDIGAVEINPAHVAPIVSTIVDGSVTGTLRYCICDAQAGETVGFASGVTGTVTLANGELLVGQNISVVGPGAKALAVDGNAASRVFHILNGVTAYISGLTISNGAVSGSYPNNSGGGIYNDHSTLTVSNCTVSGNTATYGGGMNNDGSGMGKAALTIIASTLNSNTAGIAGGGIYNNGFAANATLMIVASTLSGNLAATNGGGIFNAGFSGSATATVAACTFSGNSAGAGGGIQNSGSNGIARLEIGDTILKAGASGANLTNSSGTIVSDGYNLSSDNGGNLLTSTGDQINTDPMLGSLADNGGSTPTMALRVGSPAIDKGKSFGLTTDQRGQPRPYDNPNIANATGGDGADIGAYEATELRIVNVQKTGNDLRLDFLNWLGTNYEIQSRSDLNTGSWGSLGITNAGNGGIASSTVSNAFSVPQQFYRIHPLP